MPYKQFDGFMLVKGAQGVTQSAQFYIFVLIDS